MHLVAVMVVRNEADILAVNLAHHRAQGVTSFRIMDNGSTDGTIQALKRLARRYPLRWTRDEGQFHQSEATTQMARQAAREGAEWILPIDADEFWTAAPGRIVDALEATDAGALEVPVVNFVQDRRVRRARPGSLLRMTYRVASAIGPPERCEQLVRSGSIAFVEMEYPPKWLSRASPEMCIAAGSHRIDGVPGRKETASGMVCLHAPLRARSLMVAKADHGRRLIEAGYPSAHGWHVQRWYELGQEGNLDGEWIANSATRGRLGFPERACPLVGDWRLHDVVRPWVRPNILRRRGS